MTLHATCPTNGTEIDLGFSVYPTESLQPPMPRGETRATELPSGDIRVDVSECPACGRVHHFMTTR
jgi:hypothetical protein